MADQPTVQDFAAQYERQPETEPEPSPAVTPPALEPPQKNPRLVKMAQALGLSDDEIGAMPQEQLEETVYFLNRQNMQLMERSAQQSRQYAPPPAPAPAKEEPDELAALAEYAPELQAIIRKQANELKQLREAMGQLGPMVQNVHRDMYVNQLDKLFSDYHDADIFGKGPGGSLAGDSDQFARRVAMVGIMKNLNGSLEQQFSKAAKMLFGGKKAAPAEPVAEPTPAPAPAALERWQAAGVARPTQRSGAAEPNGEKKAIRNLSAAMKELGQDSDSETSDYFIRSQ